MFFGKNKVDAAEANSMVAHMVVAMARHLNIPAYVLVSDLYGKENKSYLADMVACVMKMQVEEMKKRKNP
jgi:hypothetical protein